MSDVLVLVAAVALLVLVFRWSGRYGDRNRSTGTSLHRGPHAHVTSRGRPKKGYATREDAEARAGLITARDGVAMSTYRCDTCAKWHLGHTK